MENNTVYEWILPTVFTVPARARSLVKLEPYLADLVRPGSDVLDLCCGTGVASFWFEDQGARVTAVDFSPTMIALARQEAAWRESGVRFIEADIFSHDIGSQRFDLVACLDSLSDFPLADFARLAEKVAVALRPGGRFAVKYADVSFKHLQGNAVRAGTYQEAPERVTYRLKEYLPEIGALVNLIRNETRGEEYERRSYLYSVPAVQLAVGRALRLERHVRLDENQFLDIFVRP